MNNIEQYFQGEYKVDSAELKEVDDVIRKILPTFVHAFDTEKKSWPYKIERMESFEGPPKYSTSTNSMILAMMRLAENNADRKYLFPAISGESILSALGLKVDRWSDVLSSAREKYIDEVEKNAAAGDVVTDSATYGKNDPLSLLWCDEIVRQSTECDAVKEKLKETAADLSKSICHKDILKFDDRKVVPFDDGKADEDNEYTIKKPELNIHSFISLRLLQFVQKCGSNEDLGSDVFKFFEHRLHLQLSYNKIPDSRFDPAELAFSLEGAIRCKGANAVSQETVERAFALLEESQGVNPYWRPINPIYATSQGQILLPLSVEVANSLLRISALLNIKETAKACPFSKHPGMFKRYFRWLLAQLREFEIITNNGHKVCCGWASEHVGGDDEIHLFQTSEIACFLINYRHMLQERIAERSLAASGLKVVSGLPRDGMPETKNLTATEYWEKKVVPCFEPLKELPDESKYKIYHKIGEDFIKPRTPGKEASEIKYSILLYGPPGTGKSTVGENIAKSLGWKFITVTPSDFLAGGAAEVEARAKFIFKCLEEQKNSVILFDEIDQFLLDRESDEYRNQTGIFQFMTPGMLPKINDLRKKKRSIFIIATNYEERIDSAIKRVGRIDYKAPLMSPALIARKDILWPIIPESEDVTAENSAGCTYTDLKGEGRASIELKQYSQRFWKKGDDKKIKSISKTPAIECFLLALIELQSKDNSELGIGIRVDLTQDEFIDRFIEKLELSGSSCEELKAELRGFIDENSASISFKDS